MTKTATQYILSEKETEYRNRCRRCGVEIPPGSVCVAQGHPIRKRYHVECYTDALGNPIRVDMSNRVREMIRKMGGRKVFGDIWNQIRLKQ